MTARRWGGWTLYAAGIAVVVLWLLGDLLSDRWAWSQWLSWIPVLVVVPAGGLVMLGQLVGPRSVDAQGPFFIVCGLVFQLLSLWGIGLGAQDGGLRMLQWSAGPAMQSRGEFGEFVVDVDPDVAILHGVRQLGGTESIRRWVEDTGAALVARGEYLVLSKVPIEQFRIVAWSSSIVLAICDLDVGQDAPLRLLLVDLPSDPERSRQEVVSSAQALFSRVPEPPDLIIGDFNLTESSWQLQHFMPGWTPMWRDAGVGWGGTFPRAFPIYRIDHVLQGPDRDLIESMTTVDPGMGRHRAQLIVLKRPQND